jgi:N-acyl-D-aspartate/D-glutamate deacylase
MSRSYVCPNRWGNLSHRLDLTHATLNFPENKGRAPELLNMIDQARSVGAEISLDTYPYLPGCTTLASLLPSWASSGGPDETLRRLEDEPTREKIRLAIEVTGCDGGHGIPTNWEQIQVGSTMLHKLFPAHSSDWVDVAPRPRHLLGPASRRGRARTASSPNQAVL